MTILDRSHAPRRDGLNAMLLALLIIVPITLAHASPPDQIWLAGVYDQADFDDVVYFLTSTLQATESIVGLEANPRIAIAPKLYLATLAGSGQRSHLLGATPSSADRLTSSDPPLGDHVANKTVGVFGRTPAMSRMRRVCTCVLAD